MRRLLPFTIALAISALACQPAAPRVARLGDPVPDVTLTQSDGQIARLADLRGRVVLLNFWATWCVPCRAEMPELQQLADELAGERLTLWTVDLQEDAETVDAFRRDLRLNLPALLDTNGDTTRAFGVRALPATFLIDARGVLRDQRLGPLDTAGGADRAWNREWLQGRVRALLAP